MMDGEHTEVMLMGGHADGKTVRVHDGTLTLRIPFLLPCGCMGFDEYAVGATGHVWYLVNVVQRCQFPPVADGKTGQDS